MSEEDSRAAVAVGDELGAERDRLVHGRAEVGHGGALASTSRMLQFGQVALSHVEVEGDLLGPAAVGGGQGGRGAGLADLLEAAVGGGAGGKAVVRAVGGEVGRGVRVVVGVDDRDGLAGAVGGGGGRQAVGVLEVARAVAGGGGGVRGLGGDAVRPASAFWKAVVPPVTRSALQAIRPFVGVAQARVHVTLPADGLGGGGCGCGGRGAWPVVAESGEDECGGGDRGGSDAAPSAAYGRGCWGVVVRNGQPPGRG